MELKLSHESWPEHKGNREPGIAAYILDRCKCLKCKTAWETQRHKGHGINKGKFKRRWNK